MKTDGTVVKDKAYKVFIDGGHGTTGLEIRDRLSGRSDIEIIDIEEDLRKDLSARVETAKRADVTIMCLPDGAARELAAALPEDVRVIDTSTAHRVDPGWVYGMPELCPEIRGKIRNANRVANPGCHATGFILLARPLADAGIIPREAVLSCFCVTGYSGGGRKMIEDYELKHVSPAQYALGQSHKHLPEMKLMSGLDNEPVFCPVVGDYYRGMVMTIEIPAGLISPAGLSGTASVKEGGACGEDLAECIKDVYRKRYSGEELISIAETPENGFLYSDTMAMKDGLEIMVSGNSDRILLISRFDNLGKGASGAAVQNLNIMLGIDEARGLRL